MYELIPLLDMDSIMLVGGYLQGILAGVGMAAQLGGSVYGAVKGDPDGLKPVGKYGVGSPTSSIAPIIYGGAKGKVFKTGFSNIKNATTFDPSNVRKSLNTLSKNRMVGNPLISSMVKERMTKTLSDRMRGGGLVASKSLLQSIGGMSQNLRANIPVSKKKGGLF